MEVRLSPNASASMKCHENTKFGDLENGDIFYMPNLDDHAYMKINTTADDKRNILDLTHPSYWQVEDNMTVVKREIIMLIGFEGEEK